MTVMGKIENLNHKKEQQRKIFYLRNKEPDVKKSE
jgi:hypothetical protein